MTFSPRTEVQHWSVTPAEAGQKLLQFLERRLARELPRSALQRWIRTGQVRVDGRRAKPFDRIAAEQVVRIPPYIQDAVSLLFSDQTPEHAAETTPSDVLDLIHETDELLVLAKPAGLAMHPGTGLHDSLATRLAKAYAGASFMPTAAHRLDRETSGLLLAAKTYGRLQALHELFRERRVLKTYLAWVAGDWTAESVMELRDQLEKARGQAFERVRTGQGKEAGAMAACLHRIPGASLLAVRLLTGRTHQIRVQLSGRGFPILGDSKYAGPPAERLYLHAWRLEFPDECFRLDPQWPEPYSIAPHLDDPFSSHATCADQKGEGK